MWNLHNILEYVFACSVVFIYNCLYFVTYSTFCCHSDYLMYPWNTGVCLYVCMFSCGVLWRNAPGRRSRSCFSEGRKLERSSRNPFSWHRFFEVRRVLLSYRTSFKQSSIVCTVTERKINPILTEFWVTVCVSEPISLEK
jgi:hypothetical protein